MAFEFRPQPAVRTNIRLLIGISGPTGSGKTFSAMMLAKGLSGGKKFCVIDTENGRASIYADDFDFDVVDFQSPFSSERYEACLVRMDQLGYPAIVIDSGSHEHDGEGGYLDLHEKEVDRLAKGDEAKREKVSWRAYAAAAAPRKKLKAAIIRRKAHIIICLRADQKTEIIDDPNKPGKKLVVPKRTMAGFYDWIPVVGKEFPYEFTTSLLLLPDKPGVPKIIKPNKHIDPIIAKKSQDQPITDADGVRLSEWAQGRKARENVPAPEAPKAPAIPAPPEPVQEIKAVEGMDETVGIIKAGTQKGNIVSVLINDTWYSTFHKNIGEQLIQAKKEGATVMAQFKTVQKGDKTFHNIEAIQIIQKS